MPSCARNGMANLTKIPDQRQMSQTIKCRPFFGFSRIAVTIPNRPPTHDALGYSEMARYAVWLFVRTSAEVHITIHDAANSFDAQPNISSGWPPQKRIWLD